MVQGASDTSKNSKSIEISIPNKPILVMTGERDKDYRDKCCSKMAEEAGAF